MADAIFISYRRDDSEGEAGRLFDDLTRSFGSDAVFMDVAGIRPGVDFRKAIEDNVASCGVFLAVIGPTWLTIANADGKRRLDDPNDFVALEISSALRREVPVIPVLVHDAKMPAASLLPESLASFAYHNSVEISHARWSSDVALLIEALKAYVTPKVSSDTSVHATVPVQLPAPHPPGGTTVPEASANNRLPKILATLGGVLVLIAILIYFVRRPRPVTPDNSPTSTSKPFLPLVSTATAPAPAPGSVVAQPVQQATSAYDGTWMRSGRIEANNSLGKLVIAGSDPAITVHAFGNCKGCDWGVQPGVVSGANVTATFVLDGPGATRTVTVTLHPLTAGLDVIIDNTFQGSAARNGSKVHEVFVSAQ